MSALEKIAVAFVIGFIGLGSAVHFHLSTIPAFLVGWFTAVAYDVIRRIGL